MPQVDSAARVAFIAIVLLTLVVAGYHRLQARRGGPVSRAGEGLGLFLAIRLSGLAMLICMLLILLAPNWVAWTRFPAPAWLRWIGAALGLVNVLFLGWTLHTLGKNLTDTVATRKEHTLITGGPYRFVRHPFYVAMLALAVSLSLLSAHWLLGLAGFLTFLLLLVRAPKEERALEERFGEAYRAYRARTGAVLPKWW